MREFASVLSGVGLLIFAYLLFTKYQGAVGVAEGFSTAGVNIITALQGNNSGSGSSPFTVA